MSKIKNDDELISFLSPVAQMWEHSSGKTFDQASKDWEQLLSSNNVSQPSSFIFKNIIFTLCNLIFFKPIKALLNWLINRMEKNNVFEERTLKRLKKFDLIRTDEAGNLVLLPAPIESALGKALIYILSAFSGIWIGWIIFGASADLRMICNSFAAGMIAGTLISLVMDLSYNQKEIYEKLSKLSITSRELEAI